MSVSFKKTSVIDTSGVLVNNNLLPSTPKSTSPTSYCAYQLNLSENLQANQAYTMQLWDIDVSHSEKSEANLGIWVYWGGGSISLFNWKGTSNFTNGHADYLVYTFTPTEANANHSNASNAWLNIYNSVGYVAGTMNMSIGRWKLEKGSVATPYVLNINDWGYFPTTHGFVEQGNIMSIYEDRVQAKEFIEW